MCIPNVKKNKLVENQKILISILYFLGFVVKSVFIYPTFKIYENLSLAITLEALAFFLCQLILS